MSAAPLNLALRPFRNERLPRLLRRLAWAALLLFSVAHVWVARGLTAGATEQRRAEAERLESKLKRMLEREAAGEARVDGARLRRWAALKMLVDRRAFSWTGLLGRLEEVVPSGVRLASVTPSEHQGRVWLDLKVLARGEQEAMDFLQRLEDRPEFSQAYPKSLEDDPQNGLRRMELSVCYEPQAPAPEPAAAAGVGGES